MYLAPIQIGLVTFWPEFQLSSRIEGAASSEFTTGGPVLKQERFPAQSPNASILVVSPQVVATCDAYSKVRLGPEISLKLYGFAGPRAGQHSRSWLSA